MEKGGSCRRDAFWGFATRPEKWINGFPSLSSVSSVTTGHLGFVDGFRWDLYGPSIQR